MSFNCQFCNTARAILLLCHFSFKQILLNMSKSKGNKVILCNKAFTSKTCGNCGFLHLKLGSNREYNCYNCDIVIDRDYNGE